MVLFAFVSVLFEMARNGKQHRMEIRVTKGISVTVAPVGKRRLLLVGFLEILRNFFIYVPRFRHESLIISH